jgi:DNA-binding NtrC family response regulator
MTSDKRYLFLVDDEPIQNEMLKDYLAERYLYDIKIFANGEEALAAMDEYKPEIMVLDYHLNGQSAGARDGIEILKTIKDKYPDTQVVMLSGQDKLDVAVNTMKYGAYDYVVKGESAFSRIENAINNLSEVHKLRVIRDSQRKTITLLIVVISLIILWAIYHFIIMGKA